MTTPTLPRRQRFKRVPYYSEERQRVRWRWTYQMDSGEGLMGTAQTSGQARRMAERQSGEKIRP